MRAQTSLQRAVIAVQADLQHSLVAFEDGVLESVLILV